jgi:hypothetical protein
MRNGTPEAGQGAFPFFFRSDGKRVTDSGSMGCLTLGLKEIAVAGALLASGPMVAVGLTRS